MLGRKDFFLRSAVFDNRTYRSTRNLTKKPLVLRESISPKLLAQCTLLICSASLNGAKQSKQSALCRNYRISPALVVLTFNSAGQMVSHKFVFARLLRRRKW